MRTMRTMGTTGAISAAWRLRAATLLLMSLAAGACLHRGDQAASARRSDKTDKADQVLSPCSGPRPVQCTHEYRPVCACAGDPASSPPERGVPNAGWREYANACAACARADT